MRSPQPAWTLPAVAAAAFAAVAAFVVVATAGNRLGDWRPGLLIALGLVVAGALAGLVYAWRRRPVPQPEEEAAPNPAALAEAARQQADRAREHIEKIRDARRREELRGELSRIEEQRNAEMDVVVFGTVSAGKTSLINALIGREVGETGAVMGTTRQGENHVYTLQGVEGTLRLIDTPGISEAGLGGTDRESEARRLAERADLLLFVVDHDLIRREYAVLTELARLGKRSIVVLNKKDRFPEADVAAILAKLRERLDGVVKPRDVVAIAAAPRPMPVRVVAADGTSETVYEIQEPDIQPLRDGVARVLSNEGNLLRVANLLIKTTLLGREAESTLDAERRLKSEELIDHYQWVTAAKVFANPVPALNLVQGAAVQLDLIADLARVYDLNPSPGQMRALAARLGQGMLKVGLVEAASSVVAGVFKRTPTTFLAAGAVQAVTMAYLSRIAGKTLSDYFRNGENWGPEGVEGALLRQFEANSRAEFLQDFAGQALDRFLTKARLKSASA
ncbi:YcjF family protein [Paludisphaera rhizosphaerae]|uniref:YcjF family protein n=1 Tax=Paludisphaera rhizosphaerae TaxID=2711216 RepID=UPI0013EA58A8|nr:GTP-binding protein [Paludisphaera rhizosphaerae]